MLRLELDVVIRIRRYDKTLWLDVRVRVRRCGYDNMLGLTLGLAVVVRIRL